MNAQNEVAKKSNNVGKKNTRDNEAKFQETFRAKLLQKMLIQ